MAKFKSFQELKKTIRVRKKTKKVLGGLLSKHQSEKGDKETILEHSDSCLDYFLKIAKYRNLDSIYENMISCLGLDVERFKRKLLEIVFYHDIGKVNPYFQDYCLDKIVEKKKKQHSEYSYYYLLYKNYSTIKKIEEYDKGSLVLALLIREVYLHHTSLDNLNTNFLINDFNNMKKSEIFQTILTKLNLPIKKIDEMNIYYKINPFGKILNQNIFYLLKLFYSHLVISDYYSTFSFNYDTEVEINRIGKDILSSIKNGFEESYEYNKGINSRIVKEVKNCKNLNDCRSNILTQAHKTLMKNINNNRIFMLNVPTGGGKTNTSLKLALDLIEHKTELNKLFYVFPYINIMEQNYKVIKDTLFPNDSSKAEETISNIHSSKIKKVKESDLEGSLIKDFQIYLDDIFLNNPINIISNVNFFDTFVKVSRNNRYKSVLFANSVVIIDEIQTLNVKYLSFFYKFLKNISEKYNIHFIVMSATLPDFNFFIEEDIPHLIENYEDYFKSEFFRRNKIEISKEYDMQSLKEKTKSLIEAKNIQKLLICVNTIKTSINLFKDIKEEKGFDCFLLNSLTPTEERNKIIEFIKHTKENVILISTQSIEAGVDLDFDYAIRDYAPLDSLEQVAGRVNRENKEEKKNYSKVKIIKYKDSKYDYKKVYSNNLKLRVQEKDHTPREYNIYKESKNILQNKEFYKYYKEISHLLEKEDKRRGTTQIKLQNIKKLMFQELSKEVNLIEKIEKEEIYVSFFTKIRGNILKKIKKTAKKFKFYNKIIEESKGELVKFNLNNLIKLRNKIIQEGGFIEKPIIKRIESILSIFSISFFNYSDNSATEVLKKHSYLTENNIARQKFKEEFLEEYTVQGDTYNYVDVPRLIKKIKKLENLSITI